MLRLKVTACESGIALSSLDRVPIVVNAHQDHLQRVRARWVRLGGHSDDSEIKTLTDRVDSIYDHEEKSFYNSDAVQADLDADIVMDYPTILQTIRNSGLPPEQRTFFEQHIRYVSYPEAGRLHNILNGIDVNATTGYVYTLRKYLTERAQQAQTTARELAGNQAQQTARKRADAMANVMFWIMTSSALVAALLIALLAFQNTASYAKYKAIRSGQLRRRYAFGMKELILWEPGEAVVILKNKKLQAMVDATGGYLSLSPWAGEEYKGRISYKTQLMKYTSEQIHTSDGVPVTFELGILWQIGNPNTYVSRIAADYHEEGVHEGEPRSYTDDPRGEKYFDRKLTETAEKWIRLMAGSTLREHICQLSVARLISPSVQSYIDHYYQPGEQPVNNDNRHLMSTILEGAHRSLVGKMEEYGVRIEKLEVNELRLPDSLENKLATVRLSFLQPSLATAETEAKTIERRAFSQTQLEALRGLAAIIGEDAVAKIEFLKAIGLAKIPFAAPTAPPFAVLQSILSSNQSAPLPLAEPQNEFEPAANEPTKTSGPDDKAVVTPPASGKT